MPSKGLQETLIKSYEQFHIFTKFAKNRKFKSDFPLGKMQGNFFDKKGDSPPQKLGDLKKNDIKKRLGAFNQEL